MFWRALILEVLAIGWSAYSWKKYRKFPVHKNPAFIAVNVIVLVLGGISIACHHLI